MFLGWLVSAALAAVVLVLLRRGRDDADLIHRLLNEKGSLRARIEFLEEENVRLAEERSVFKEKSERPLREQDERCSGAGLRGH